jgi:hypothetical protein
VQSRQNAAKKQKSFFTPFASGSFAYKKPSSEKSVHGY